ncbi:MAG: hypothetical protein EOP81_18975 [Variovorax sp.]|nr:MAG: hypothetical protein EOP81_18975 [Variovorax sp.]
MVLTLSACGGGGGDGGGGFPIGFMPAPSDPAPTPSNNPAPAATSRAPTADAGTAQTGKTGDTFTLDGSASSDPDGDTLMFSWTLTSIPAGSLATLTDADKVKSSFVPDKSGTYIATLTVHDGTVSSSASTVTLTVDASQFTAFDSMPSPFPPNMPSIAFQATQRSSVGDTVNLVSGTPRALHAVSVAMSSWACESGEWSLGNCATTPGATFNHPITIQLYDAANQPIGTATRTVAVPYRPSFDATCGNNTQWKAANGTCYNGFAFKVEFDLSAQDITLPDTFSYDIVYNTNSYGPSPIGTPGAYDSLNVGVYQAPTLPFIGTQGTPGTMRWNGGGSLAGSGLNIMATVVTRTP